MSTIVETSDSVFRTATLDAEPRFAPEPTEASEWSQVARVRASSERAIVTAAVTPAVTHAERVSLALSRMREIMNQRVGDNLASYTIQKVSVPRDDGAEHHLLVVQVRVVGVSADDRAELAETLLDFIADHPDPEIRTYLSVEIG